MNQIVDSDDEYFVAETPPDQWGSGGMDIDLDDVEAVAMV